MRGGGCISSFLSPFLFFLTYIDSSNFIIGIQPLFSWCFLLFHVYICLPSLDIQGSQLPLTTIGQSRRVQDGQIYREVQEIVSWEGFWIQRG